MDSSVKQPMTPEKAGPPRVGLALGGGGVRGMAHILVLELLDELRLRPSVIAGTSMGALVGALYASGMSGLAIHELVRKHFVTRNEPFRAAMKKRVDLIKWVGPTVQPLNRGGVIKPDRFLHHLLDAVTKTSFEELTIPLVVTATDFWSAEEVVLQTGELLPALRASIAVPGAFAPLSLGGRVLVDGGLLNLVPYDHLKGRCELTIAVDVGRPPIPGRTDLPKALESFLGAFEIMQAAASARKLESCPPDISIRPQVWEIGILDFTKVDQVFEQAKPAMVELRERLRDRGFSVPALCT